MNVCSVELVALFAKYVHGPFMNCRCVVFDGNFWRYFRILKMKIIYIIRVFRFVMDGIAYKSVQYDKYHLGIIRFNSKVVVSFTPKWNVVPTV